MTDRQYDLVVLGATGYTGQYVAEEVGRLGEKQPGLKYAFAGRNKEKLALALETARANTGLDLAKADLLVVNVNDEESLQKMVAQTKVVINCVGPYRYYGLKVVKACVEGGANHVDISGEPQYLEQAQLEYSEAAQKAGVHIVGSCGFDSIPADLGTSFLQEIFPGDVNSVEAVVTMDDNSKGKASINFTTMECAVLGLTHSKELKGLRKKLFTNPLPKPAFKPEPRGKMFYSEESKRWCVPNMASDRSVVMRSQRLMYEKDNDRPTQFQVYFGMSRVNAIMSILFGILFYVMTLMTFTRNLLLKYPEFFTGGVVTRSGPRRSDLTGLKFLVVLTGHGWDKKLEDPAQQHTEPPNTTRTVQVKGPDPGYFGTAILITQSAMTILEEKEKLPQEGGVFPPAAAFRKTSLRQRLENKGIHFTVVE
ncbi:Saccharopine dehydrogenase-like oxidoreductase [Chionoecetes opilio]|uniref:Saccharopine dehydrogenase-like oxidoreductase n=1 Tax=Chionoecetes opilio TaxID=41210 RepID=A0A8J4YL31_CHIOP|nr:Saccharopine dehydrogenase-like oxidoreductase [Chionoecetes opilio]